MTLLSLSALAANALATSILQGLLLVTAIAVCLRLLPRIPAAARSIIWTVVFALVLALPLLPAHHTAAPGAVAINVKWSMALLAVWFTLSLVRATQLVLSALALRRLALTATPVPNPASAVTLCTSPLVDRPSVVGFFSRRILLPPALYASLSPAELQHVLLHETEHLRRRDDWTNLLQKLALVAVPLNPVLLWVERRLCLERELACDDRVLSATGAPKAYATCLTHLAEHSLLHRSLTLALGFFERQSELTRRVHRILFAPTPAISSRYTTAATATLLVALAGGSLTLTHIPQFIHFAVPTRRTASLEPLTITPGSATFQPATFHVAHSEARATLVKAFMPATTPARSISARPHTIHHIKRSIAQPRPNPVRAIQAGWTTGSSLAPQRLVLTTSSGDQVSYTVVRTVAVATRNGWIIFQL